MTADEYTGERMEPQFTDAPTFWEHVQRYRFALRFVRGQRVLDIACGEGYGTAAIAGAGAAQVIGVDLCEQTCARTRVKYGIDARVGNADAIPLDDGSVDLVVSFETIEHLCNPVRFLNECHRVLSSHGKLIISTPNRPVYRQRSPSNPHHHHEMTVAEFEDALRTQFDHVQLFGQNIPLPPLLSRRYIRRLPYTWYQAVAPHVVRDLVADERADAKAQILRTSQWRDAFDPFAVKRMSAARLQRACFITATATRR